MKIYIMMILSTVFFFNTSCSEGEKKLLFQKDFVSVTFKNDFTRKRLVGRDDQGNPTYEDFTVTGPWFRLNFTIQNPTETTVDNTNNEHTITIIGVRALVENFAENLSHVAEFVPEESAANALDQRCVFTTGVKDAEPDVICMYSLPPKAQAKSIFYFDSLPERSSGGEGADDFFAPALVYQVSMTFFGWYGDPQNPQKNFSYTVFFTNVAEGD